MPTALTAEKRGRRS